MLRVLQYRPGGVWRDANCRQSKFVSDSLAATAIINLNCQQVGLTFSSLKHLRWLLSCLPWTQSSIIISLILSNHCFFYTFYIIIESIVFVSLSVNREHLAVGIYFILMCDFKLNTILIKKRKDVHLLIKVLSVVSRLTVDNKSFIKSFFTK